MRPPLDAHVAAGIRARELNRRDSFFERPLEKRRCATIRHRRWTPSAFGDDRACATTAPVNYVRASAAGIEPPPLRLSRHDALELLAFRCHNFRATIVYFCRHLHTLRYQCLSGFHAATVSLQHFSYFATCKCHHAAQQRRTPGRKKVSAHAIEDCSHLMASDAHLLPARRR